MSQKASEDGPAKMNASRSRRGRIPAVLGIFSAMVRGERDRGVRRTTLAGGVSVPRGVPGTTYQTVAAIDRDGWLVR